MSQYVSCVDVHARRSAQLMLNGPPAYASLPRTQAPSTRAVSPDVSRVGRGSGSVTPRAPSARAGSEVQSMELGRGSTCRRVSIIEARQEAEMAMAEARAEWEKNSRADMVRAETARAEEREAWAKATRAERAW